MSWGTRRSVSHFLKLGLLQFRFQIIIGRVGKRLEAMKMTKPQVYSMKENARQLGKLSNREVAWWKESDESNTYLTWVFPLATSTSMIVNFVYNWNVNQNPMAKIVQCRGFVALYNRVGEAEDIGGNLAGISAYAQWWRCFCSVRVVSPVLAS